MTKKRRAKRAYFDKEKEANLPARRTKDIANTHLESVRIEHRKALVILQNDLEKNEDGKELFDNILKGMSSPENE